MFKEIKHYHINGKVGGSYYTTPAIPYGIAAKDLGAVAAEHNLVKLSSGAYGDPEMISDYLVLTPCENRVVDTAEMAGECETLFTEMGWAIYGGG